MLVGSKKRMITLLHKHQIEDEKISLRMLVNQLNLLQHVLLCGIWRIVPLFKYLGTVLVLNG